MKIEKIDKNFSTAANIGGAVWYDVKSAPFKTYGVYFDASAGLYARMPRGQPVPSYLRRKNQIRNGFTVRCR